MASFIETAITTFFGGLAGYAFGWLKDDIAQRQRRKAIATALVAELDAVEPLLTDTIANGLPNIVAESFSVPMHDRFVQELQYFKPEEVQAAFAFGDALRVFKVRLAEQQSQHVKGQAWLASGSLVILADRAVSICKQELDLLLRAGAVRIPPEKRTQPRISDISLRALQELMTSPGKKA